MKIQAMVERMLQLLPVTSALVESNVYSDPSSNPETVALAQVVANARISNCIPLTYSNGIQLVKAKSKQSLAVFCAYLDTNTDVAGYTLRIDTVEPFSDIPYVGQEVDFETLPNELSDLEYIITVVLDPSLVIFTPHQIFNDEEINQVNLSETAQQDIERTIINITAAIKPTAPTGNFVITPSQVDPTILWCYAKYITVESVDDFYNEHKIEIESDIKNINEGEIATKLIAQGYEKITDAEIDSDLVEMQKVIFANPFDPAQTIVTPNTLYTTSAVFKNSALISNVDVLPRLIATEESGITERKHDVAKYIKHPSHAKCAAGFRFDPIKNTCVKATVADVLDIKTPHDQLTRTKNDLSAHYKIKTSSNVISKTGKFSKLLGLPK